MTLPYGATQEEWQHFDFLGLGPYLLPVVSNPDAPISANSALKSRGKTPSRYNHAREIIGIPQWVTRVTTDADLAEWSAEPDYGICIRTSFVRAFDLDLTDADAVRTAVNTITTGAGTALPLRSRVDSTKCLLIFQMEGEHPKQVLKTAHGAIELLGNGNQFIACGQHKDGARYTWRGGVPNAIPTLSEVQFRLIQQELRTVLGTSEWSEGRLRRQRDPAQRAADDDSVTQFLASKDMIVGRAPGRVDFKCPWVTEHSAGTDPTATSYFLPGTGGFETGHAKCLHASHAGKTDRDFMDAIGYTDFFMSQGMEKLEDVEGTIDALVRTVGEVAATGSPVSGPRFVPPPSEKGIKPNSLNVVEALMHPEWCGMVVRYDTFEQGVIVGLPGQARPLSDTDYTQLDITLTTKKFGPAPMSERLLSRSINYVASLRQFDSAKDWVESLPLRIGVEHIERFFQDYMGVAITPENADYYRALGRYMWTTLAGRASTVDEIQANAAVILIGDGGTGKTESVRAVCPNRRWLGSLNLNWEHYQRARELKGKLVIEIPELQGLKTRDAEAIKHIISTGEESLIDKFKINRENLVRRGLFIGTSNDDEFLAAEHTGNRRFLPALVGPHQDLKAIVRDRDSLWGEGLALFRRLGHVDWQDVQRLAHVEQEEVIASDPWDDAVFSSLDDVSTWSVDASLDLYVSLASVLTNALHMDTQKQGHQYGNRIARILVRYGLVKINRKLDGRQRKIWVRKESNNLHNRDAQEFL